jgi:uncharacterized membrane protein
MFPILVLWIHLVAAIIWIGGMLFSFLVLKPMVGRAASSPRDWEMMARVDGRFRTVRWISLVTLLITGVMNLLYEGGSARLESSWGAVLMVKLLFVAIVMGLSGVNDFILSPGHGTALRAASGGSKGWMEGLIMTLGLFIVFIAVYLHQA